jgi:hypothetical protein
LGLFFTPGHHTGDELTPWSKILLEKLITTQLVKTFVPVINYHEGVLESGGTTPCILNFGTRSRYMIK